eukprot:4886751-Amphidinium_carterae.1
MHRCADRTLIRRLNIDQISAMAQILREGVVPYVDFAVFGPRHRQRLYLQAYLLQPDCTRKRTEVAGPPDFGT